MYRKLGACQTQITDDLIFIEESRIDKRIYSNFNFEDFGGHPHHLTLIQDLKNKKIVNIVTNIVHDPQIKYPDLIIEDGYHLTRTRITLTMNGRWFVNSCVRDE